MILQIYEDDKCWEKYHKAQLKRLVASNGDHFMFCLTNNCQSVLDKSKSKSRTNDVKCEVCKISYCHKCKKRAHGRKPCEYRYRCPKCEATFSTDGRGWPKIVCSASACKYEWCHACGMDIKSPLHQKYSFGCVPLIDTIFNENVPNFLRPLVAILVLLLVPSLGLFLFILIGAISNVHVNHAPRKERYTVR